MIISASRRTDIPAFFSEWIINRLKEQYAYVRNPMNIHQVSKINLSPDVVDCIVFWSKNPKPIINKLNALKDYMYYFQFTLNAYDKDFEENLPTLSTRIDTFQTLSNYIGKERVIWRYDPIIINEKYSIDWHIERFKYLTEQLCLYTEKVTISFIDLYTVNNAFSVIKVENYADKEPIVVEGMLRSGKDDGNSHGIGIKSINNSLSKYDGKMSWSYDKAKGMFRTVISINNSQINI